MDPITGVVALSGITIAAMAGLRLKTLLETSEGFETLPGLAVEESQSRYNSLTSMVNPILNSLAPVKQESVDSALGNLLAPYDPTSPEALKIKNFMNTFRVRTDAKGGIYDAIQFCRESVQAESNPFTTYAIDADGNRTDRILKRGREKVINANETLKFDEVCGVCLTSGIDEDGKPFNGKRGMLIDPSVVESALKEQKDNTYPFPRVAPSLGKCEGSPNSPAFAINQKTLEQYVKRMECMKTKEINESNNCALCYESDTFTFVPGRVQKSTIYLILMGIGRCSVSVKNINVKNNVLLNETTSVSIPLILNQDTPVFDPSTQRFKTEKRLSPASEGDPFTVDVSSDPAKPDEIPIVYGYLASSNPNGGKFAMPLNLILTRDGISNSPPNRTGGFFKFPENDIEVAKIRPAGETGREMRLQGELPFTFVEASEFSAIDCPSAPFQTKANSISRFATDQPCYAKGSKPGAYNDACLRERILDAGCTNAGELYKNPKQLNRNTTGRPNSLSAIYTLLRDIASNDLIDPEKTKLCSGRNIASPCDYFRGRPNLKMEKSLSGPAADNAKKCLSYLYQNKGQDEFSSYSGLPGYRNDTAARRNIYCLPEGELNPERNLDSLMELARIYDMGFRGSVGVDGVKKYLTSILEMAVDTKRNANTDVERRAAIRKCFGTNFNPLSIPTTVPPNPRIEPDPPRYTIRGPQNAVWKLDQNNILRLRSGNPIEVDIVARPDVFRANQGRVALFIDGDPSRAIRHSGLLIFYNNFTADNYDFAWYPIRGDNNTVFFYNDYDKGCFLGYDATQDRLIIVPRTDPRRVGWTVTPYPTTFVKNEPALLTLPAPPQNSLPLSFRPAHNTLLGTAQNNGDYRLTMTIYPTQMNTNDWSEIVHFTKSDNNCCVPGDRMPAIWFIPNSTRLHIRMGDDTDGNWGVDTTANCALNQANTFVLECRGSDVSVTLNSQVIRVRQPTKRPTGLAKVYGCTRFFRPATASISNFRFTALN